MSFLFKPKRPLRLDNETALLVCTVVQTVLLLIDIALRI